MPGKTKKQIVIEAAARLFRDKGYAAASMRDLAKDVGMRTSSLYNHINSKEGVLQKICFDNANKFLDGITAIEREHSNPLDQLRALIALHIRIATNDLTSATVFNDEWRHLTEPHLSQFTALRKNYEDRFRKIIETGIQQGIFTNVDTHIALQTVLSALRWVYYHRPKNPLNPNKLEHQITMLLLNGIKN